MSSFEFDVVKAEKADAIGRYKRHIIFTFCSRAVFAITLLCSSYTWLPLLHYIASSYLPFFNNQFFVFLLVNALVFLTYHFSSTRGRDPSELYDYYVSLYSCSRRKTSAFEENQLVAVSENADHASLPEDSTTRGGDHDHCVSISCSSRRKVYAEEDKQLVVVSDNADHAPVAEEKPVCDLTVNETYVEERSFRRTRSEKSTVEKRTKSHRRELRRSETENVRELVVGGGYSPVEKSVQEMNSEEFRIRIESFIASNKKLQRDEKFSVLMEERKESFTTAITNYV